MEEKKVVPIDANRLLLVLEINFGHTAGAAVMGQLIREQPMLDVEPVVRCKDCIWGRVVDSREPKYQCVNICRDGCTQWLDSNDFCSYGERKEE